MGNEYSLPTDEELTDLIDDFFLKSKNGPGVYTFRFKRKKKMPRDTNDGDPNIIWIGSEVTDENNILDVTYFQLEQGEGGNLTPVYQFQSGRAVNAAISSLLRRGYKMKML